MANFWIASARSRFTVRTLFLIVAALLLPLRCVCAQQSTLAPETKAKIEAAVMEVLRETGTPSAQVGIVQHGQVVYVGALGDARLEPVAKATVDMTYGIGSISKQFTAAAVMVLVERGKVKLDDPVSTWLPELEHSHDVTLRMLLNHVSGYSDNYTEDYLTPEMATRTTPLDSVKRWTSKPLDFVPGTKWQYSNTNFELAGLIVERASGEPFFQFLEENVLRPAGVMHAIDLNAPGVPALPQGYVHFGFGPARATPREAPSNTFAAGELAMPIADLMHWDTVVLKRELLKPTSWQTMQAEVALPDGIGSGYGMGFFLQAKGNRRVIQHSGELNGFTSLNMLYPETGTAVAVLTNAETAPNKLVDAIEPLLFPVTEKPRPKPNAVAEDLTRKALTELQQGKLDRNLLNSNLTFFFTDEAIGDYKASLAGLGEIQSIEPVSEFERGGMTGLYYKVHGAAQDIIAFVYVTKEGTLDQLLLRKIE
jgi:D-alanyl-D-alanine carboxypeptidase